MFMRFVMWGLMAAGTAVTFAQAPVVELVVRLVPLVDAARDRDAAKVQRCSRPRHVPRSTSARPMAPRRCTGPSTTTTQRSSSDCSKRART